MPVVWTESRILKLVILYSQHECLRNPVHPNFKNKFCRYKAYKEIVDCMNICGLTVRDCIKKITYIKAQYCYELSKISAAISCEKFYKPTASWFPMIHQQFFPLIMHDCTNDFWKTRDNKRDMFKNCHCNETNDQLTRSTSMELNTSSKFCDCPYANYHCNKSYKTKSHTASKSPWFRSEGEKVFTLQTTDTVATDYLRLHSQKATQVDVGNNIRRNINTEHTTQTDASYFKTQCKTCQTCMEDKLAKNADLAKISMKSDLDISCISNILAEEDKKWEKKTYDEFDMFGRSIAFQLRNINFEVAIKLEKRIQDLIAQERLNNIKSKCSECYTSSSCSECKIMRKEMICSCGLPMIMIKTDQSCEFDCKQ